MHESAIRRRAWRSIQSSFLDTSATGGWRPVALRSSFFKLLKMRRGYARRGRGLNDGVTIELGPGGATAEDVVAVARRGAAARLTPEAVEAMEETVAVVERLADSDEPAYGISTGFGSLAQTRIPADRRTDLQRALIRSHAAGMGPPVEREVVRAMMFLRA